MSAFSRLILHEDDNVRRENTAADQAYLHRECAICFDKLSVGTVSSLCDSSNHGVCRHIYHTECISALQGRKVCPVCRKQFAKTKPVPPIEVDPRAWFDYMDEDHSGHLSYEEILDGLKSQLDIAWDDIETDVDTFWSQWDKDGNQAVSFEEFSDPENGVLAYLKRKYPSNPRPPPPNLIEYRHEWFDYWDEDNSYTLDKAELTRALIKTFKLYNFERSTIEDMVESVWPIFDEDNSGVIERQEFLKEDNFADVICAQILQEQEQAALNRLLQEEQKEEDVSNL